jgi:hypothetical protein
MKTSRFSEPQILAILRQAEGGVPVPELPGQSSSTMAAKRSRRTLRYSSGGKRSEERHSQSVLKTLCGQWNNHR